MRRLRLWAIRKLVGKEAMVFNTTIHRLEHDLEIRDCTFVGHEAAIVCHDAG